MLSTIHVLSQPRHMGTRTDMPPFLFSRMYDRVTLPQVVAWVVCSSGDQIKVAIFTVYWFPIQMCSLISHQLLSPLLGPLHP
jgi:hypothetical protein